MLGLFFNNRVERQQLNGRKISQIIHLPNESKMYEAFKGLSRNPNSTIKSGQIMTDQVHWILEISYGSFTQVGVS